MQDFLAFRKFITPVFIQIIFWIGAGACMLLGLVSMIAGASSYGGGQAVLGGLVLIVLGPLGVRVYCEVMIVLFRILDRLGEISERHRL